MDSTSPNSLHFSSWFVLLLGVLLVARQAVTQSEKLSENGANVCGSKTGDREHYHCCDGWSQVGDQCTKAICIRPCLNGTCTKPDNCSCFSGYHGNQCERYIDCPLDKWGSHGCTNDCQCPKNAMCSPQTGNCTCLVGWTNKHCTECDYRFYGVNCQYHTKCYNGASRSPGGKYICGDGYYGDRCEYECEQGKYGHNCAKTCKCPNNTLCSHINGVCCECYNNAKCHPNGSCDCSPGWTGENCDKPYRSVTENQSNCSCVNQAGDVNTCHCRLNDDSSSPANTKRYLKLLVLLVVFPLIILVIYILRFKKKIRIIVCQNEEFPLVEQSVVEQPVVEQPVVEQPVVEQRVVEQPVVEQRVVDYVETMNPQEPQTSSSLKRFSRKYPKSTKHIINGQKKNKAGKEK